MSLPISSPPRPTIARASVAAIALSICAAIAPFGTARDEIEDIDELITHSRLEIDGIAVSISERGTQTLRIDFGADNAGESYVVAGSQSGVFPGTMVGGVSVPLNFDKYSEFLLENSGAKMFTNFTGKLDDKGMATATITLPETLDANWISAVFFHSVVVFETKTGKPIEASNVTEIVLMP